MMRIATVAGLAITVLTLACGGSNENEAAQAPETAAETTAPETAAAKPPAPQAAAPTPPAETPPVAAPPMDATKQCLALAAQQKWSEALDPCTQAAKEHPTDLRIKHAAQQAQAAAEG